VTFNPSSTRRISQVLTADTARRRAMAPFACQRRTPAAFLDKSPEMHSLIFAFFLCAPILEQGHGYPRQSKSHAVFHHRYHIVYLSGTNTRRVRRALAALFGGAVGKDTVSRVWGKVKGDWDAWNARSLAGEPIIRLILDGTVVRVRLDKKATRSRSSSHRGEGAPVVIPARFTEDVRADFRARNRLDFRRVVRIGVVVGWPSQSRPLKGSPRDLRGLGSCERQVRRREPTEPEYVNSFHREVPKP
jgi:Transposase, Mutator family